ncbi:MAG: hypothetical protein AW12_01921 [Candidatus Accumulibacter sp. BA-94]|nr:MAG: hypothetical protein AW12_01921 [Candidatus Accumulibacter sp. BA-94]
MKGLWLVCIACGLLGLGGCGGVAVDRYRDDKPVLDLAQYFDGIVDGGVWHVDFDDWLFLVDDQVMLNRARLSKLRLSKLGFDLREATVSFRKR